MDEDQSRIKRSSHLSNCLLLIALMMLSLNVKIAHASDCRNRLDIVISVDTTSSTTAANFENVKTEVKGIVSSFTIGEKHTRLALVSISRQAQVVVNFDRVTSLSDFNAAVDRLTFSTDTADLSQGIKVAKEAVLTTARTEKISKILILVKDKRSVFQTVPDTAVLTRVTAEAAGVKSLGAVIHAVGVGGVWQRVDLVSLYGTDYLLFKNRNKALESIKSLSNIHCEADCPDKGTQSKKEGPCSGKSMHVIQWKTDLATDSTGQSVCRSENSREFASCTKQQSCGAVNRNIGPCGPDNQRTVENVWTIFDPKIQACASITSSQNVSCNDPNACPNQIADVIFLLDKSGSMGSNFKDVKEATEILAKSLSIGPSNVRVGLILFENEIDVVLSLSASTDKESVLKIIRDIPTIVDRYAETYTHLALEKASEIFRTEGRQAVSKFVFIITDGRSSNPSATFDEIARIKNAGATVYAIGIAADKFKGELKTMTAPEASTNMFLASNFQELHAWSQGFSKRMCIHMAPPHPRLCEDKAFVQSISECVDSRQQITKTRYSFNADNKCIKETHTTVLTSCRATCIDPINGNEYFQDETWTTLCHVFVCSGRGANPFAPQKSGCLAADGTCKEAGSQPFKCLNEKGTLADNCLCTTKNGKTVLVIDVK